MDTDARELTSKLLVPLDGSEHAEGALPYALAISGAETEVILLAVAPRAGNVRNVFGKVVASPERVEEGYEQVARQNLERAASRLAGRGTVHQEFATGDAAEEILRVAAERGVGMIVMSALGRGTFGGWALGSTADRVVRAARQPVMIVHQRGAADQSGAVARIGGLVVPVDASETASEAIPVAAALARALGALVRVLQAGPNEGRADAGRAVESAVARLESGGVGASGEVLDGEPAATVIAAVRPGEVVVLTSHGEAGAGRWGLGGVADKLLRHGSVSVVLVPSSVRAGAA